MEGIKDNIIKGKDNFNNKWILKLGIKTNEIEKALNFSRPGVTKGLQNKEKVWLTFPRLISIYVYLRNQDPNCTKATALWEEIQIRFHTEAQLLLHSFSKAPIDPDSNDNIEQTFDFKEIWIFSSEPFELKGADYLQIMFKVNFLDSKKKIVYFCPHDKALKLTNTIKHKMQSLFQNGNFTVSFANIYVIEAHITDFMPHYSIVNPGTEDSFGGVYCHNESFLELPKNKCGDIVSSMMASGFQPSANDHSYLPEKSSFKSEYGIEFKVIFNSIQYIEEFSKHDD